MQDPTLRPSFFAYLRSDDSDSLDDHVHQQIGIGLAQRRNHLIDDRNLHTYRHGNRWTNELSKSEESEMHRMSAEATIHSIDIIDHDTTIIDAHVESMIEQLFGSLMEHMYEAVGEAAASTGNMVSAAEHQGSIPAGFLAMLKKIEFGVDRYGRAQRPSLHVSPKTGEQFIKALDTQTPEFHLEVETISREKENSATAREAERLSRYRWE